MRRRNWKEGVPADYAKYFQDVEPKFDIVGAGFPVAYIQDYERAVGFYTKVFGPPGYIEGEHTKGWQLGETWLTLFPSREGGPQNTEFAVQLSSEKELDRLRTAWVDAGGKASEASIELMYERLYMCSIQDPFGTQILLYSRLQEKG